MSYTDILKLAIPAILGLAGSFLPAVQVFVASNPVLAAIAAAVYGLLAQITQPPTLSK